MRDLDTHGQSLWACFESQNNIFTVRPGYADRALTIADYITRKVLPDLDEDQALVPQDAIDLVNQMRSHFGFAAKKH